EMCCCPFCIAARQGKPGAEHQRLGTERLRSCEGTLDIQGSLQITRVNGRSQRPEKFVSRSDRPGPGASYVFEDPVEESAFHNDRKSRAGREGNTTIGFGVIYSNHRGAASSLPRAGCMGAS